MAKTKKQTVLELCAGGGGQFLGLEKAGFECVGAVEIESAYCYTLSSNRPKLNVINEDLKAFNASSFAGVGLVAGGVPCPPFSIAGKQLGQDDDRDLFPSALKVIRASNPSAILIENVPGFASAKFKTYREHIQSELKDLGYWSDWRILNASDFGVPQLRPRFVLVGIKEDYENNFKWPVPKAAKKMVGEALHDLMAQDGWQGAEKWSEDARGIAPTLVGGSKKHGGPDLGPSRAREQWRKLRVDGMGIADAPPNEKFPVSGLPRLTTKMAARVQGFPDSWIFPQRKTAAYRQIGNAFPPPVAAAVGRAIKMVIESIPA